MNNSRHQSLFFVSLPELQKLCASTVTLSSHIPETETRNTQIKICRQLLFLYQDILSAPVIGTLNQISVVMAIPFYKSGICQDYIEQQGATLEAPQTVSSAILQTCLSYTLTARLAPRWNKAGHLLVQGKDFLSRSGRQNAVVLDLNVSEKQLCISVESCSIRLPPPELGDFDISANALKLFDSNENTVIHQHSILSNWCYVLPSMKMGQIINISHVIPPESPFRSYEEFQMHWKNLYGYILPEDFEETKIYFSVYFKPIGERFFTYPLSCIRSQPVQYFPRIDSESVLNSFLSDMKRNLSHLCGFPVKMTSKALYAAQELSRAPEIKSKHMKLDGEMVCVVSLTQAPPRKQTLPRTSSHCSMENSHWMERLIKEPETHTSSSSRKGTEKVSIEATEKSMNNRQIPGVLELPVVKSFGMPVDTAFKLPPSNVSKIIPIFKGKLMQMNGKTTNQMDGKKRENAERHSAIKNMGVSSSVLTACKSSTAQVYKPAENMSVKNPTHSSVLQVMNTKTNTMHGIPVFRWRTVSSGKMTNSDFSDNLGGNSSEVNHKKANSPSFLKNVGSVLQKSNINLSLNRYASPTSSARRGKKFASQNTVQVLEKPHQSKKEPLQTMKLDNEMTNFGLSQQQTKRSNEGAGLNIHESLLNDMMCIAKNEENKSACHSKQTLSDSFAKTTSRLSKSNFEQMITGNEYLTCETLTSKPTSSVKESNAEASVKKGCTRRRQKEEGYSKSKRAKRSKPPI
ncbi:uncharacterized protein C18orf63 homolog [Numenius arquata]|uniref:uncharacterized protein C18orf63 homolog n=1 Tax=Numenius arquata TaxID=31919 RepID=UPI003D30B2BD